MAELFVGLAAVLLLLIVAGLARVVHGPTEPDRMLAAQLFGTVGVATLLLLADALGAPVLRDIALLFALLAAVAAVAFVRRAWRP